MDKTNKELETKSDTRDNKIESLMEEYGAFNFKTGMGMILIKNYIKANKKAMEHIAKELAEIINLLLKINDSIYPKDANLTHKKMMGLLDEIQEKILNPIQL